MLLFAVFSICSTLVNAQGWASTEHKSDELAGTKSYTSYIYTDSIGNIFVYWSNSNVEFRIKCAEGIFDFFIDDLGKYLTHCKVGLYSMDGQLLDEKKILMRIIPGNAGQAEMYFPMGDFGANRRKGKKILEYVTKNDGYIRILANLHGEKTFDIKVPCRK